MQDLRLGQTARRLTWWANVIVLSGLAMTGIVFADNNNWAMSGVVMAGFGIALYFLGTAAYRVSDRGDGRVEAHSLLGLKSVDLRNGFRVKRAWFGPGIVVLRAGRRRCRINGALGRSRAIEQWLTAAAQR